MQVDAMTIAANLLFQRLQRLSQQHCVNTSNTSHLLNPQHDRSNPLMGSGNNSAASTNMKLVHWPLMGGLLHLVQRGGDCAGSQPAQAPSRCTKCNNKCNSLPINGSVPITVLLYNGLCGFNVPAKGLTTLLCVIASLYQM